VSEESERMMMDGDGEEKNDELLFAVGSEQRTGQEEQEQSGGRWLGVGSSGVG
jgi:hypothetical protein